ncbi:MAG: hypothetical protein FRX49_01032 [Trebouxia sp. A1-2]|nr:MAG: hypothetical protein FRX49_01032 [Trebouxia sp. A1-2]
MAADICRGLYACSLTGFGGTNVMNEVFINQEADPYVSEIDGTLDLAGLNLQPASIVINRKKGLVDAQTSKTKRTFADIQQHILQDLTAGGRAHPLHISGASVAGTAQTKSFDPDPLDTDHFATASDYSNGENITPAKAQLQTIIGREKQRVAGEFRVGDPLAVNGRCQKRCLPVPLVCEAFGKYEPALRHCKAYQLTEADWCLYHDLRKVLPFYWPYEKSLQSAVLQALRSAEHGLGRSSFGAQNLRVTNQTESDGHIIGITEVGILEFKRVEGPAELQIAKYCMRQMRDMRSASSRLYLHSFMQATCELLHDLNTAALNIFAIEVQATARMAVFSNGFPYVLWGMDRNLEASKLRYVHGDLRLRNLAVQYAGNQVQSVIMLDLDWAGIHGSHVYVADINPFIAPFTQRPASVQRGAVMLQEHDRETIWSEYKAKLGEHFLDMDAS